MALVSRTAMGLGQGAPCPSAEQLAGIVDSNDPCQNPVASVPLSLSVAPSTIAATGVNPITGVVSASSALPSASTLASQASQQTTMNYLLIGGALLFVVLLVMGGHR